MIASGIDCGSSEDRCERDGRDVRGWDAVSEDELLPTVPGAGQGYRADAALGWKRRHHPPPNQQGWNLDACEVLEEGFGGQFG